MLNKKEYLIKSFKWIAVALAVIMLVCGLLFGKVVEETLFLEIAKWVVMYFPILAVLACLWYTLGQYIYDFWYRKRHQNDADANKNSDVE